MKESNRMIHEIRSIKIKKNGAIDWSLPIGHFEITVERTSYEESTLYVCVYKIEDKRQIVQYEHDSKAETNKTVVDLSVLLLSIKSCRNYVEFMTLRRINQHNLDTIIERLRLDNRNIEELTVYL